MARLRGDKVPDAVRARLHQHLQPGQPGGEVHLRADDQLDPDPGDRGLLHQGGHLRAQRTGRQHLHDVLHHGPGGADHGLLQPRQLPPETQEVLELPRRYPLCYSAKKVSIGQKELNNAYEGIEFEVGFEYIYIGNVFMFNCFFVSLQPICVVAALLGYLMMFWVQKYCMFYRYRRPVPGSDFINQAVWQIIHLGPLLYSLGSLTWANFLPEGFPKNAIVPNLISLGFSILLVLVPIKSILVGCFFSDQVSKLTLYSENRITFSSEYDRLNPSTQEEGLKEFQEFSAKFAEDFKKLSAEKQAELAKKKQNNNQRGQLNQYTQANHQAPNLGMFGGQSPVNLFSQFAQPAAPNPYQIMPQIFQHQGGPPSMHRQASNQVGPAPQQQPNPFSSMFGAPQPQYPGPAPMMSGMGGIPGMGPSYMNPMANLWGGNMGFNSYGFGGPRMW